MAAQLVTSGEEPMVDRVTVAETQPVWKESRGKQRGRKQKATGQLFLISNYN